MQIAVQSSALGSSALQCGAACGVRRSARCGSIVRCGAERNNARRDGKRRAPREREREREREIERERERERERKKESEKEAVPAPCAPSPSLEWRLSLTLGRPLAWRLHVRTAAQPVRTRRAALCGAIQ